MKHNAAIWEKGADLYACRNGHLYTGPAPLECHCGSFVLSANLRFAPILRHPPAGAVQMVSP